MNLFPMKHAPKDGTKILVKGISYSTDEFYRLCKWMQPYSIASTSGAWVCVDGEDDDKFILEQHALGWIPEPSNNETNLKLKIWNLTRKTNLPQHDDPWNQLGGSKELTFMVGCIVVAEIEEEARNIAQIHAEDESEYYILPWLVGRYTNCVEIGIAHADVISGIIQSKKIYN
jgi:hypothetical protein